jgi:pantoate--beta-alanine ligase
VVASVFVNPTQFGANEDSRAIRARPMPMPRVVGAGCHLLWLPEVATMYPYGVEATVRVRVPG